MVYAILVDKKVVIEPDPRKREKWLATADLVVGKTVIGETQVLTVFEGAQHAKCSWFLTSVMGGPFAGEFDRYDTWDAAEQGHAEMVKRVEGAK